MYAYVTTNYSGATGQTFAWQPKCMCAQKAVETDVSLKRSSSETLCCVCFGSEKDDVFIALLFRHAELHPLLSGLF